jgi:hypothetical protein
MKTGWSTPFVWKNGLRTEIVGVGPGAAISYDLEGKELWRLSGIAMIAIPTPFAYDGWLYVDGGSKRPMFVVKPGASGDISLKTDSPERSNEFVAWSDPKDGTYSPTPVVYEGGLYVLNEVGILTRFDAIRQTELQEPPRQRWWKRCVHVVAVGLQRQDLLSGRRRHDLRRQGRREIRNVADQFSGRNGARHAGDRGRPAAASHRDQALFDSSEVIS